MTATDELRRMLDERGVHWRAVEDERKTLWESNGLTWEYFNNENGNAWLGFLGACEQDVTPEQAIAATLGAGTCHDLAVTPAYRDKTKFECSECGYEYSAVGGFGCDYGDEPDFNYCPNCGRRIVGPTTNDADAEADA